MRPPGAIGSSDTEVSILAHHRLDPFVLANIQTVVLGNFPIVFECFLARRLLQRRSEGNVANFEQLRRSEKRHVRRIVKQRIHQAALIHDDDFEPDLLRFDCAR